MSKVSWTMQGWGLQITSKYYYLEDALSLGSWGGPIPILALARSIVLGGYAVRKVKHTAKVHVWGWLSSNGFGKHASKCWKNFVAGAISRSQPDWKSLGAPEDENQEEKVPNFPFPEESHHVRMEEPPLDRRQGFDRFGSKTTFGSPGSKGRLHCLLMTKAFTLTPNSNKIF